MSDASTATASAVPEQRPPVDFGRDTESREMAPATSVTEDGLRTQKEMVERWYYEDASGRYYVPLEGGTEWVGLDRSRFEIHLRGSGFKVAARRGESKPSEVEVEVLDTTLKRRVEYAGPMAGWNVGVVRFDGDRALITRSQVLPPLVENAGPFPMIDGFLQALLVGPGPDGQIIDQRPYFLAWMKFAMRSLYDGEPRNGLCLAIAGDPSCGKTLLKNFIRICMGGRECLPYDYMIGKDAFNKDFAQAPLWAIDDEAASTRGEDRAAFAAQIKKVVANSAIKLRAIQKDGIIINPFRRLVICLNNDPDCIMVLPSMDEHVRDKILLLRGYYTQEMPAPLKVPEQSARALLQREMSGWLWWLLNVWHDEETCKGRFGSKPFHHPDILEELMVVSKEQRILDWINRLLDRLGNDEWRGTSSELKDMLVGDLSPLGASDKSEVGKIPSTWLGKSIRKLSHLHPTKFTEKRTAKNNQWVILRDQKAPVVEAVEA